MYANKLNKVHDSQKNWGKQLFCNVQIIYMYANKLNKVHDSQKLRKSIVLQPAHISFRYYEHLLLWNSSLQTTSN
jgi:hypothetical protein